MKEVYEQSPQMGDADCLEPRLEEVKQIIQKLDEELKRNQVYIGNAPYLCTQSAVHAASNRHPTMCSRVCCVWTCCQIWLKEADSRLTEHGSRRHSGGCGLNAHAATPGSSSSSSSLKQLEKRHPASRERYLLAHVR